MIRIEKRTAVTLISLMLIIFITLFLNSYFNATSGEAINPNAKDLEDKYFLSGPDPYYNMRIVKKEYYTGHYPYWSTKDPDPLLNYPIGKPNSRPPLFNTLFVIFAKFLSIFMQDDDAIGLSMQFLPALYGALLVIPVYMIGSLLFNRRVGLISALLIPLIPIHLGSGHGSAYSLADHDSFILLLGTTLYFLILRALQEKDLKKSIILSAMAGIFLGMEALSWAGAYFFFAFLALYFILMMFIDIIKGNPNPRNLSVSVVTMLTGFAIALPSYLAKGTIDNMAFVTSMVVLAFGIVYLFLSKKRLPWLVTVPSILISALLILYGLYLIKDSTNPVLLPLSRFANHIFGGLAYVQKSKVYLTIAEASTFGISRTFMSFGPALFLLAWFGFIYLILWKRLIKKWDEVSLFITVWFLVEVYLTGSAGRFINDLVPEVAILSACALAFFMDKLRIDQMVKHLRNVRDLRGLKKAVKISHVIGIAIVVFIVVLPNSFLSMDAAIPSAKKTEFFGKDYQGAFGLSLHTEKYWEDAFRWLREQDRDIKNEENRPAFISWWDYGFYCAAMGEHPTVADNFQSGIEPAGNFHTAQSEEEAIAVLIVRLVEGDMVRNDGKVSEGVREIFSRYLGNNSTKLVDILEDPIHHRNSSNSSYGEIIGKEYGGERYRVREKNAMYHDAVKLLTDNLDEEQIVMLYRDIQLETGWSIRYYGVEGYDINIFNVFTFLSDKGTFGYETDEDDYFKLYYIDMFGKRYTPDEIENLSKALPREELRNLGLVPWIERKDPFYNSMVYRVYFGSQPPTRIIFMGDTIVQLNPYLEGLHKNIFEEAVKGVNATFFGLPFISYNATYVNTERYPYPYQPTAGLKHFVIKYLSPLNATRSLYFHRASLCLGMPAVVIAKYYEGARINGTVTCMGKPMQNVIVIVRDDFRQILQVERTVIENGTERKILINRTVERIPHDYHITGKDGRYHVIAPAGNVTLSLELTVDNSHRYLLEEVTIPISEEEAMRKPGVDYNRTINITIEPANLEGRIFDDINRNGSYDEGIDQPLENVRIELKNRVTGENYTIYTDSYGIYNITDIFPGIYKLTAYHQEIEIHNNSLLFLSPGNNTYNITKPKPAMIKGTAYYDRNANGMLDDGEEMEGVIIKLVYSKTNATIGSVITNEDGYYEFDNLMPGSYRIEAISINSTTGNPDYTADVSLLLEENVTREINISLNLAKIKVSGYTLYDNRSMDNVTIRFAPARDIENNTALYESTKSNETGYFEVYLTPGIYNVSASKEVFDNETNKTIDYSYEGRIEIKMGQSPITDYMIALVRK